MRPPASMQDEPHCQINVYRAEVASGGTRDHAAVTAFLHRFADSARRIRSVESEMRWRWIEGVVDGGVYAEKPLGGAS